MYYEYFGLNQPPFRITPDTSLFFPGGDRGAILEALVYAVLNNEGIVKVTGEVGAGKTMLCRMLEQELPDRVEVVYLANPSVSPENILHAIAFELKLPVQSNTSRLQVMHQLQEHLLERHAQNQQVVVFVEEAQGMPIETLEEIRLLSNLETRQHKLLQIVLFGQPELDERIAKKEIRQLKERITYSFRLNPFKPGDIREYLNSRLRACGYRSTDVFAEGAVRSLAQYSKGLVRRINILADKSMLAAYADNTRLVTARHVDRAAADSEFVPLIYRYRRQALAGAALAVLAVAAIAWMVVKPPGVPAPEVAVEEPQVDVMPAEAGIQRHDNSLDSRPVSSHGASSRGSDDIEIEVPPAAVEIPAVPAGGSAEPGLPSEAVQKVSPAEESPPVAVQMEPVPAADNVDQGVPELEAPATLASLPPEKSTENPALDGELMDLSSVVGLQDLVDPRLSPEESEMLQRQLVALPPEDAPPGRLSPDGDECKLCWSIIYRPLAKPENL